MLLALTMTNSTASPTPSAESSSVDEAMEKYLPYLKEAQKRLLITGVVFFVAAIIGAVFYKQTLTFIMSHFDLTGINIVLTSPYQVIELAIYTGLYTGLVVTLPLLVFNLITFLKPALSPDEFKYIISLVPVAFALFITGFLFGVWVMNFVIVLFTKATLEFSIGNIWDITAFFSQIIFSAILLGTVFQFPIVLTALMRFGIVTRDQLVSKRAYVYATALIFAAALPPTDPFSLALLVAPLIVLFEAAMLLNRHQVPFREGGVSAHA
jgi:sec-independent protein translocase protein TatC